MVAIFLALSTSTAYLAVRRASTSDVGMTRTKPARPDGRSGAVRLVAEGPVPTLGMPTFHRIGAPTAAELEHDGPDTARRSVAEMSLVAPVWPPSGVQGASSVLSWIGWPATWPPLSLTAIFAPFCS